MVVSVVEEAVKLEWHDSNDDDSGEASALS